MPIDPTEVLLETEEGMQKAADYVIHEMGTVRTGKASPSLVEGIDINVPSYGSVMKLKELALISTPEPRLITVSPYDAAIVPDIERGLRESRLGINPSTQGKLIRLPIPELSGERRQELAKIVRDMAEQARVRIRAERRDGLDKFKTAEKASDITEDQLRDLEKEIQDLTDKFVKIIDEALAAKEIDITTV